MFVVGCSYLLLLVVFVWFYMDFVVDGWSLWWFVCSWLSLLRIVVFFVVRAC